MESSRNFIQLKENQHATYIVRDAFDYYLYLSSNSSATFRSITPGGTIKIRKNIWGPGSIKFDGGNIVMQASIGVAPAQNLLS